MTLAGLVIPGGESTTMSKLIAEWDEGGPGIEELLDKLPPASAEGIAIMIMVLMATSSAFR